VVAPTLAQIHHTRDEAAVLLNGRPNTALPAVAKKQPGNLLKHSESVGVEKRN
jgi:hypothetical protein